MDRPPAPPESQPLTNDELRDALLLLQQAIFHTTYVYCQFARRKGGYALVAPLLGPDERTEGAFSRIREDMRHGGIEPHPTCRHPRAADSDRFCRDCGEFMWMQGTTR